MKFVSMIHSEGLKVRHTLFGTIHIIMPLMGALLFTVYYMLYGNVNNVQKLNLILEITATVFPLLISIVVGLNVALEEKTSYFQLLLAFPDRSRLLLAKLVILYGAGIIALSLMFFIFILGISVLGLGNNVSPMILIFSTLGITFSNLVIYILHLFLSLKFGLGISLFWGVFESLQCILYSNIRLQGVWRYIPFSWSMNWIHDTFDGSLLNHSVEWLLIAGVTFFLLFIILKWFSHWEGRKNYD